MASIADFQVAYRADLTCSLLRTFVPKLELVSQFARLVPLSASLLPLPAIIMVYTGADGGISCQIVGGAPTGQSSSLSWL